MDFPEVRKFLLASYHDLPNILFIGALILGSVLGYLPLVWMALGMILNGAITAGAQSLFGFLKKAGLFKWDIALSGSNASKCYVGYQRTAQNTFTALSTSETPTVVPSHWISASAFFAVFSIYNSIRVATRETKPGADPTLTATRRAFSISTAIIGCVFLFLVGMRYFTGCETGIGAVLGILVGTGVAIGYWHILDGCGTGKIPDVLQVVGAMAPPKNKAQQPVMCTAE
jgi:hypothetical protein